MTISIPISGVHQKSRDRELVPSTWSTTEKSRKVYDATNTIHQAEASNGTSASLELNLLLGH